ncbi:MAG: hypothetical protein IT382_02845 [Deltaproteobacteria bacterium]|nr:hypothetical protein [Deltaproteobacteria bacterium]
MASVDLKKTLEEAKGDLAQVRDELRVKLHLAKQDAQDAWKAMEPRIQGVERKLEEVALKVNAAGEEARLQASLGAAELKARWPGLEGALGQLVNDVKRGARDVATEVDVARVKTHLAEMDAADAAEQAAKKAQGELKKASAELGVEFEKAAAEIKSSVSALKKKLFS